MPDDSSLLRDRSDEQDICPKSRRTDKRHSWFFDGDDPYVICAFCDERRDALTRGRLPTDEEVGKISRSYSLSWRYWDENTNDCEHGAADLPANLVRPQMAELVEYLGSEVDGEKLVSLEVMVEL